MEWEKNCASFEGTQLVTIIAYYINQKWPAFGGLGIAVEENYYEEFIRMGSEYTFLINDLFFIAPGTSLT